MRGAEERERGYSSTATEKSAAIILSTMIGENNNKQFGRWLATKQQRIYDKKFPRSRSLAASSQTNGIAPVWEGHADVYVCACVCG